MAIMRVLCLIAALAAAGCVEICEDVYLSCTRDEDCHPGALPPGKCLDDRAVGRMCGLYYDACPTKLRWHECSGKDGQRSPWAGRCVRPEFLPDAGTGADATPPADAAPPVEMSAGTDAAGPS